MSSSAHIKPDNDAASSIAAGSRMMQQVQPKSAATRADATTVRSSSWPIRMVGTMLSTSSDDAMAIEKIARLVGHGSSHVTENLFRQELRPIMQEGAEVMDRLFGNVNSDPAEQRRRA
jgi:hypothetical protein